MSEIKIDLTALKCQESSLGLGADDVFVISIVVDTDKNKTLGQEQHVIGQFNSGQTLPNAITIFDNKTLPSLPDNFSWALLFFEKSIIGLNSQKLQLIIDEAARRVLGKNNIAAGWVPQTQFKSFIFLLVGEIIDLIDDLLALLKTRLLGVVSGNTKEVNGKPITWTTKGAAGNRFDFTLDGWFSNYSGSYAIWSV
jgi:hypothetical protein